MLHLSRSSTKSTSPSISCCSAFLFLLDVSRSLEDVEGEAEEIISLEEVVHVIFSMVLWYWPVVCGEGFERE